MTTSSDAAEATDRPSLPTRRAALLGLPLFLAGCAAGGGRLPGGFGMATPAGDYHEIYGATVDGGREVEALDFRVIDRQYLRHYVAWSGDERPGSIVVDPYDRFLYLVQNDGRAIRYGVGVGREGFGWSGRATIGRKGVWPTWTPPHEMTLRDKAAAKWAGGMPGGPDNPLGARALYLFQGSKDTLYRIHGNNEPASIGKAVSSGCIRMLNQDIIDLHRRVPTGASVTVRG